MTWAEFWGDFSPHSYAITIKSLGERELRKEHAIIRQKSLAAKTGIGAGVLGVLHTCGTSLVASGINLRKLDLLDQKLSIIEDRMESKGWSPTEMKGRDILMAVGPIAVVSRLSLPFRHVLCDSLRV